MTAGLDTDVLIIGSGAAGLTAALHIADRARVTVLAKGALPEGSTWYAQGGISAVVSDEDTFESHVRDTLDAGAGLCDPASVRFTVENGPASIAWLESLGVNFTVDTADDSGAYHLTREGGHAHRRVIHADDATGEAVETTLLARAQTHPHVTLRAHRNAVDVITRTDARGQRCCVGAYVLDTQRGRIEVARARAVVLATGGASKAYLYTSNPDGATGDGIAMAWRAGCRVANMEFMQFHPTCLYHPRAKSALISEAVRGEGGVLRLPDGSRFMPRFDERAELAPRDVVARTIDHEMKRLGADCVYLDISHRDRAFIEQHFPNIHAQCAHFGFDLTREPVPVVPAAHYTCGGVATDLQGATDVAGLYAVGETACTGLHGANRMASNSLLECLVFARAAAAAIGQQLTATPVPAWPRPWDESQVTDSDEEVVVAHNWDELRRFMWDYVGIVRSRKRLERARNRIDLLVAEIAEYYGNCRITSDLLELRNIAVVADLIIRSAAARHESRGLHFTMDHPERREPALPTVMYPIEQAPEEPAHRESRAVPTAP
jgi:L-aspartate oxidase